VLQYHSQQVSLATYERKYLNVEKQNATLNKANEKVSECLEISKSELAELKLDKNETQKSLNLKVKELEGSLSEKDAKIEELESEMLKTAKKLKCANEKLALIDVERETSKTIQRKDTVKNKKRSENDESKSQTCNSDVTFIFIF
jgi:hypothetical protein